MPVNWTRRRPEGEFPWNGRDWDNPRPKVLPGGYQPDPSPPPPTGDSGVQPPPATRLVIDYHGVDRELDRPPRSKPVFPPKPGESDEEIEAGKRRDRREMIVLIVGGTIAAGAIGLTANVLHNWFGWFQ